MATSRKKIKKNRYHQQSESQRSPIRWRMYFIASILLLAGIGLAVRMFQLAVLERGFLTKQSNARIMRTVNIPAHRGMIEDRNGVPLAVSAPMASVWANPKMFHASQRQDADLAALLKIPSEKLIKKIKANSNKEFIYLKRGLTPEQANRVRALDISGVFFERDYRRFYPQGAAMSQVLGFTNIDDQGQEGLELEYNSWLAGSPGNKQVLKDRLGHIIADVDVLQQPVEGKPLVLSIDSRIQYLAYETLENTVQEFNAGSGSVVVLNVKTGEILAMANVPSYNPNVRNKHVGPSYRNRAVTDVFEPGSTMKAFSIANALDSGKYTPETIIDTRPGWMMVDGNTIQDDADYGVISVTQVLQKSSNVGVAKMTLSLPPTSLWDLLNRVGFGERTQSGFPGEATGVLLQRRIWRPTDLATMSFGYGISVTALQLAHAYAIIADDGKKLPVTFIKLDQIPTGPQVLNKKIAKEMITMLTSVLKTEGSGWRARVPGYTVAGKTGTAYIAGPNGYYKNRYTASFVGIAPVSNPQVVVAVVVHDVRGRRHFGGQVAAPAFATIMAGALRYLDVPPDDMSQSEQG